MTVKHGIELKLKSYSSSMTIMDPNGKLCLNKWLLGFFIFNFRTANNLKNRFYTVLRNLIKLLFRKKSDSCPKLPGEIPSKDLSRLYDGK
jgi:hypothetical protein